MTNLYFYFFFFYPHFYSSSSTNQLVGGFPLSGGILDKPYSQRSSLLPPDMYFTSYVRCIPGTRVPHAAITSKYECKSYYCQEVQLQKKNMFE